MDRRRTLEPRAELGGTSMEPPALVDRDARIDGVANELVAEVQDAATIGRHEDRMLDVRIERFLEAGHGDVHDEGQDVDVEGSSDDGTGSGDRLGAGAEPGHASTDRILDR